VAGELDLDNLWQQVLEAVGRAKMMIRTLLITARPVSLVKGVMTISFDPEFKENYDLANDQPTLVLLQTKLKELGHPGVQIKFALAENSPAPITTAAAPTPAPAASAGAKAAPAPNPRKPEPTKLSKDEFKNDPLIQKALEVFKGQIVEVRV
jgi:hypothetical protein